MRLSTMGLALALFALPSAALADVGPLSPCGSGDVICATASDCPGGGSCGPLKCLDSSNMTQTICSGGTGGSGGSAGTAGTAGSAGSAGSGGTATAGSGGTATAGSSGSAGTAGSSTAGTGGTSSTASNSSSDDGCTVKAPGRSGAIAVVMLVAGAAALFLQRRR